MCREERDETHEERENPCRLSHPIGKHAGDRGYASKGAGGADLFEIKPARPYPEDYEQHVAQATRERDSGFEPPLAEKVANIAIYDEIYLGFPVWGETMPPPVRSFLKTHDLRGKTVRPFITHGGYGVGSSPSVLATHALGARIEKAFVMEADQERRTMNTVHGWLGQLRE